MFGVRAKSWARTQAKPKDKATCRSHVELGLEVGLGKC
jgi:hypothetical protein